MKDNISLVDHLVLAFYCKVVIVGEHIIQCSKKRHAQNIAASENHGKQHKFSDHWKKIKTLLKKWLMAQKRQKDWLRCKF